MIVDGNRLYVTTDTHGIQAFDITDPSSPRVLGGFDTPWVAKGIFKLGRHLLVSDWIDVMVYPSHCHPQTHHVPRPHSIAGSPSGSPILLTAPNPASSAAQLRIELSRAGPIDLLIVDASGRRVREIAHGRWPAGTHAWVWDGRDNNGQTVANGVYFIRLRTGLEQQSERLVWLR
jgi:hypothetical protein